MAIGSILIVTVRSVIAVAIGFLVLRVPIGSFDVGALGVVFLATMAALYSLGMLFSSLFLLYGREAWHLCNAMVEPVYFLSGMYFPLRTLGAFGAVAAGIIPLGLGTDAMRQVLLGEAARGLLPIRTEVALLAAMAAVLFVTARLALAWLERLSKQEGKLTQRWQ
jgi:ABC-2 type transport system permease protein